MGIGKVCCHLLLEELKAGKKGGKMLQLGRQYILFDRSFLNTCAKQHNFVLRPLENIELSFDAGLARRGFLNDTSFFQMLGFDEVESLDYSPYEDATIIWDMNKPIPECYWEQYDTILDGGTGEHVFHFPQFMENIYRMLKPGGKIIHLSPSHNYVDHGFYMFSPTIHFEYYAANHFKIVSSLLIESLAGRKSAHVYSYQPGSLKKFDRGGFGKQILDIFFIAEKTPDSMCGAIPQQLSNQMVWSKAPTSPIAPRKKSVASKLWRKTVKPLLKAFTPSSSPKMPPLLAKYPQ